MVSGRPKAAKRVASNVVISATLPLSMRRMSNLNASNGGATPRAQVAGRRRLTVGPHRHQAPLPGVAQPDNEALNDRVAAGEPERVRRHGDPRVLAQHGDRRRHVRSLVSVDEPFQQG